MKKALMIIILLIPFDLSLSKENEFKILFEPVAFF